MLRKVIADMGLLAARSSMPTKAAKQQFIDFMVCNAVDPIILDRSTCSERRISLLDTGTGGIWNLKSRMLEVWKGSGLVTVSALGARDTWRCKELKRSIAISIGLRLQNY